MDYFSNTYIPPQPLFGWWQWEYPCTVDLDEVDMDVVIEASDSENDNTHADNTHRNSG